MLHCRNSGFYYISLKNVGSFVLVHNLIKLNAHFISPVVGGGSNPNSFVLLLASLLAV